MPTTKTDSPNSAMRMSSHARTRMRDTEKAVLRYYHDMGKNKGNCTWGIGFYVHKGVCTEEELARKVSAASIDIEYEKRIAEAERRVKAKVARPLTQAQFDALVSFTYNTKNYTNQAVYDALNRGDFAGAAGIISSAVKVKVNQEFRLAPGLIARRAEESAPFRNNSSASAE